MECEKTYSLADVLEIQALAQDAMAKTNAACSAKLFEAVNYIRKVEAENARLKAMQPQVTVQHLDRLEAKGSNIRIDKNETQGDFVVEKNVENEIKAILSAKDKVKDKAKAIIANAKAKVKKNKHNKRNRKKHDIGR